MFDSTVWLVIMVKICHYWCLPIFTLYQVNCLGLWLDCFDECIQYHMEENISWQRCVTCYGLHQFIRFGVFGSLDVFHGETLEVVLHFSVEGQISRVGSLVMHSFTIYPVNTLKSMQRVHL
jgi:hypothetical protein